MRAMPGMVGNAWRSVWRLFRSLLIAFFGEIQWKAPAWARWFGRRLSRFSSIAWANIRVYPQTFMALLVLLVTLVCAGWVFYQAWWVQPRLISAPVKASDSGSGEITRNRVENRVETAGAKEQ